MKKCFFFGLFSLLLHNFLLAQGTALGKAEELIVQQNFTKADNYMELSLYDSAQLHLDIINKMLPVKSNSIFNYSLSTRQSEVYYYNNLQQLGLQESYKSLNIALSLNDSLLLADCHNFIGLFLLNMDSLQQAVFYLKKGIQYCKILPTADDYRNLSMPHHLYGNLAEALYKLQQYDSALYFNNNSLKYALQYNKVRGVAVAYQLAGELYIKQRQIDSAFTNFSKSSQNAMFNKDIDVRLLSYAGLANVALLQKQSMVAEKYIDSGMQLLKNNTDVNKYFALRFLQEAVFVYTNTQNNTKLIATLKWKSDLEASNLKSNNKQLQAILKAGVDNEKRLLSLEVQQAKQKQRTANIRLLISLFLFALVALAFVAYRYFQKQKNTANLVRHKISQDLHDEIGASLSSLQIYGTVAEKSLDDNPVKTKEMLSKIKTQSRAILENMSDIVWSMKSNQTDTTSLEIKIKNFATELLQDKNIILDCNIQKEADIALENMNSRRNILAIIKEVLNNAYKYSSANIVQLKIYIAEKNWVMQISDNGKGFEQLQTDGNGLKNIAQRVAELKGIYQLNAKNGTAYIFVFPISKISNTGWN